MERKAGTAVKPGETELARQLEYIRAIRAENDAFAAENGRKKKFYSLAMGCQMNAHDSEKLEGMLDEMGFDRTDATHYMPESASGSSVFFSGSRL